MTKSIRDMTIAQKNSFEGHNIIAKTKELKDEINKNNPRSIWDTSKNVGNYEKSILHLIERHYIILKKELLVLFLPFQQGF